MRRIAVPLPLYCFLILLAVAGPVQTQTYELPPCTRAEFRTIFDQIAENQLEFGMTISSVDDLLDFARTRIENREDDPPDAPLCADAFAYQRLIAELTGDFIGRTALELGDVPAVENPYRLHLESDQERIEDLAARMLNIDRSKAPPPSERSTSKCARDQLIELEDMLAEFLTLLGADPAETIPAIDALLRWRDEHISQAPMCSAGIELVLLLSAVATDAAAMHALATVAPDEEHPYESPLAENEDRLREWRTQLEERRARYSAESSTTYAALPACSLTELADAYDKLMPEYTDLLQRGRQTTSASDLQGYSEAYIDYRRTNLAHLPACAEAFAAAWEVRQLLGDLISGAAQDMLATPASDDPFSDRLEEGSEQAARMIDSMASQLEDAGGALGATVVETAAACNRAELLLLGAYLLPEFRDFGEAALSTVNSDGVFKLTDRSLYFRDMLWRELPRCAEAIELGLVMRRVAADFIAMLWLEAADLPVDEIPQLQAVIEDMTWLLVRAEEIDAGSAAAVSSGKTYYISAGRGANIRACGSTDCAIVTTLPNGQKIDVADDSGAWYQVNLPNNQVGYIASFLVSNSPPTS